MAVDQHNRGDCWKLHISTTSTKGIGTTKPPKQVQSGVLGPGIKWREDECDHALPYSPTTMPLRRIYGSIKYPNVNVNIMKISSPFEKIRSLIFGLFNDAFCNYI
jgi:hypothetical protein